MDEEKSATILSGLSEYLQYLCSKNLAYTHSISFTGQLCLNIDEKSYVELIVDEKISKQNSESSTHESKSHTEPISLKFESQSEDKHCKNSRNKRKNSHLTSIQQDTSSIVNPVADQEKAPSLSSNATQANLTSSSKGQNQNIKLGMKRMSSSRESSRRKRRQDTCGPSPSASHRASDKSKSICCCCILSVARCRV